MAERRLRRTTEAWSWSSPVGSCEDSVAVVVESSMWPGLVEREGQGGSIPGLAGQSQWTRRHGVLWPWTLVSSEDSFFSFKGLGSSKRKLAVGYGPFWNRACLVLLHFLSEPLRKTHLEKWGFVALRDLCPACQKHTRVRWACLPAAGLLYPGVGNPPCQSCTFVAGLESLLPLVKETCGLTT